MTPLTNKRLRELREAVNLAYIDNRPLSVDDANDLDRILAALDLPESVEGCERECGNPVYFEYDHYYDNAKGSYPIYNGFKICGGYSRDRLTAAQAKVQQLRLNALRGEG